MLASNIISAAVFRHGLTQEKVPVACAYPRRMCQFYTQNPYGRGKSWHGSWHGIGLITNCFHVFYWIYG